jgi:hypothetical protein
MMYQGTLQTKFQIVTSGTGVVAVATHGRRRLQGFLPQQDEFYFTTAEKKILEKWRCSVPNFMNDYFIYVHTHSFTYTGVYRPYSLVPDRQIS